MIYIAYGSNLHLKSMFRRCPTAKVLGTSEISGYELLFRGSPGNGLATVEPNEAGHVPVLAWEVQPRDVYALDLYEGYPHLYRKDMMEIQLDGEKKEAMVYLMNPGYEPAEPSPFYLGLIREGYESAGFDPAILDRALAKTKERCVDNDAVNFLQIPL